jgi:hypothetical protein
MERQQNRKNKNLLQKKGMIVDKTTLKKEIIREIRGQAEVKYFDSDFAFSLTTAPTLLGITAVPNSVGQSGRVGDQMRVVGVDLDIIVEYSFSSIAFLQDMIDNFKISFFSWKVQSSISLPTVADIYQNQPGFGIVSPYNYDLRKNYKIINTYRADVAGYYDSTVSAAVPTSKSVWHNFRSYKMNHSVTFDFGATTGINQLYLFAYSDSGLPPHPAITLFSRVYYTDE